MDRCSFILVFVISNTKATGRLLIIYIGLRLTRVQPISLLMVFICSIIPNLGLPE